MREMVCSICPNGCLMKIEKGVVSGNKCKKGEEFAIEEIEAPKRSLTTTVKTKFSDCPVLPVKLSGLIPKEKIFQCINEINKITVSKRIERGDVIVKNILGLEVDLIATSSKLLE